MTVAPVLAFDKYPTNGHLIAAVARLGHLRDDDLVLDASYGRGTWWTQWQPRVGLFANDPYIERPADVLIFYRNDVRWLPLLRGRERFDAVCWDPPYKLNGTPTEAVDGRYGVAQPATRDERLALIVDGAVACAQLTRRTLLVKVQDQVVGGRKVWQTDLVTRAVEPLGFRKADRLDFASYRPQPPGRAQRNAHVVSSQLLIFTRERTAG